MSDRTEVLAGHLAPNPTAAPADKLVGRCSCGSVSWEGRGDPAGQSFVAARALLRLTRPRSDLLLPLLAVPPLWWRALRGCGGVQA